MEHHDHTDLVNGIESGFWGALAVWLMAEALPWAVHTFASFLSGAAVMVGLFFLKRWLQRSKWLRKKFPKLYQK
jgi:hypothetical protein